MCVSKENFPGFNTFWPSLGGYCQLQHYLLSAVSHLHSATATNKPPNYALPQRYWIKHVRQEAECWGDKKKLFSPERLFLDEVERFGAWPTFDTYYHHRHGLQGKCKTLQSSTDDLCKLAVCKVRG